jgi:hypothetical protein
MRRLISSIAVIVPAIALAQEAPPPDETVEASAPRPWYDALAVNGFASVGFTFNANRPADESNQLRVFDGSESTIEIDVVELVVQKPVAGPGDAGFRVDMTAGSSLPRVTASAGLFRDDMGNAEDFDLQQAFVSYVARVGRGLRVDIGKFVTHAGYELIEGYDGYNDHYSRAILFGYAIPFTHTGIKASLPISDQVSVMLMVANGWDNVADNNTGKTFGGQVLVTPLPGLTASLNLLSGPEQSGESGNFRHLVDVVATYQLAPMTVGVNFDFASEDGATMEGERATWVGAALYLKADLTAALSLAARGEWFSDPDGVRTGVPQTLVEGTLSPTLKLGNVVLRGDLRIDRSDEPVFVTDDEMSQTQLTVALNAIGVL